MSHRSIPIRSRKRIIQILEYSAEEQIPFETSDDQGHLVRLKLEKIICTRSLLDALLFRPVSLELAMKLQNVPHCSPALKAKNEYAVALQWDGTTYSFHGELLRFDPGSLSARFLAADTMYEHRRRKYARVPIGDPDEARVCMQSKDFPLVDLSVGGVGVASSDAKLFQVGQRLPVTLVLEGHRLSGEGTIAHITSMSKKRFLYGISVSYEAEKSLRLLRRFIQRKRGAKTL